MRPSGRADDQLREIVIQTPFSDYAEGSCLIKFGNTEILCNATLENRVPRFLKNTGSGWVTAEYGMLPRSTHSRMSREASMGKQGGRTIEIQRLISRSLRAAVDLKKLGERQIIVDCDVLKADGGTRTAAITGGYVALYQACQYMLDNHIISKNPVIEHIAAVSCGIFRGKPVLDLEYAEDSEAQADANFVLTAGNAIVEIQGTAEDNPFAEEDFYTLFSYAKKGISEIVRMQKQAMESASGTA